MNITSKKKNQASMEYLVTYGWAFMIIVFAFAMLWYLGVFNTSPPTARPGSCYVIRPNGQGTGQYLSLAGLCSGEWPEYSVIFTGANSFLEVQQNMALSGNTMTVSAWISPLSFSNTNGPREDIISCKGVQGGCFVLAVNNFSDNEVNFLINIRGKSWQEVDSPSNEINQLYKWYFVVGTYNGTEESIYVNSQLVATRTLNGFISDPYGPINIGSSSNNNYHYFPGYISNIQVYNVSLSSAQIKELYTEGIGGAPQYLPGLLAWWPLNGDTRDYSGNGYNGGPTNVTYDGTWEKATNYIAT